MPESTPPVRYSKPKILVVDLPASVADSLKTAGYSARSGTFGRPYRVNKSDGYIPVVAKPSVPNYAEQEVVIINLEAPEAADGPEGEKFVSMGEKDWFAKASLGVIDPRPRTMLWLQNDSDRILRTGGTFVIFADGRLQQELVWASVESEFIRNFRVHSNIKADSWSVLSTLSTDFLEIEDYSGTEMRVVDSLGFLSTFLRRHSAGVHLTATFRPLYPLSGMNEKGSIFFPLATNKYEESVAGIIMSKDQKQGIVLILPQIKDKEAAVLDLVRTVLPELRPHLFPDHEGGRWVHREEYEHPSILERKAAQLEAQRKANEEVARIDAEIEAERERLGFLHGILTKSGDALVADVKRTLEFIGFQKIVDLDETDESEANKQEDLQVHDQSPLLLVEIKGLAGMPTESDTLQVTKYVLRRVRQFDRTDVTGLSVVNHQRNLPALERDHENVFTSQQIQDAELNGTGLMTTWDLYRLVRGMVRWGWPGETVRAVLYGRGRLQPYLNHYTLVGTVAHYWTEKSVISIDVGGISLAVGDRVGYLFDDGFFEEDVTSLQVDKNPVLEAGSGQRVGMKTMLARSNIPVGTRVYKVSADR